MVTKVRALAAFGYLMPIVLGAVVAGCSAISNTMGISGHDVVAQQPNATLQEGQIVGGGTKQMALDAPAVGGFLPQPALLKPGGPGRADLVYLNPKMKLASY